MKWLKRIGILILLLLVAIAGTLFWRIRDRFPGYAVDLDIKAGQAAALKAGFAALKITPEVPDTWTDNNGNARYDPDDGDTYQDGNGNGKFDPVWIAGFHNRKPAMGVHDDLWARTMVIDDGTTRMAIVSLDLIGFGSDDVIRIRKRVAESAEVDYVIVTSTHTHDGPDVIGMWGESDYKPGVDKKYMELVYKQAATSVEEAVKSLRPAKLQFAQDLEGAKDLVMDTRPPYIIDHGLRLVRAIDRETNETLGTLLQWANHPELIWADNTYLSSDFCHDFRKGLEEGVFYQDSLMKAGLGGIAVYINGSIGGLMTTDPETGIADPFRDTVFVEPSYEKVRAAGEQLALLALSAFADSTNSDEIEQGSIALRAKSIELPLQNKLFRLAGFLGILDRGYSGWFKLRSELSVWTLGPAMFVHQPGEIYPEIVEGGIETPAGQDFEIEPVEVPALRTFAKGKYQFFVGLSNDMVGYIIPKSEWDVEPPYIYDMKDSPYGEINSVGWDVAPIIHSELREMMEGM
ncbi:MAG: hypothetical protein AAF242_02840 [Bacteroidota bacterium]